MNSSSYRSRSTNANTHTHEHVHTITHPIYVLKCEYALTRTNNTFTPFKKSNLPYQYPQVRDHIAPAVRVPMRENANTEISSRWWQWRDCTHQEPQRTFPLKNNINNI